MDGNSRTQLRIGNNPDFDKAVLLQILETLSRSHQPLLGSDIIMGLNKNNALTAQLPSGMLIFSSMQPNGYAAGILKFALHQGWVRNNPVNVMLRASR